MQTHTGEQWTDTETSTNEQSQSSAATVADSANSSTFDSELGLTLSQSLSPAARPLLHKLWTDYLERGDDSLLAAIHDFFTGGNHNSKAASR